MRFLCLRSDPPKVINFGQLVRTRTNFFFSRDAEKWDRWMMELGKFERIFDTERPVDAHGVSHDGSGYEKRGNDYYQTWVKK